MKILVLCDYFGIGGGVGRIAQILAEALSGSREVGVPQKSQSDFKGVPEVKVLTAHAPQNLQPRDYQVFVHDLDYPYSLRNYLGLYHPKAIRVLKNYLQHHCPDVVFIHNLHTNWSYYALKIFRDFGIPHILTFHDVSAFTPYIKLCNYQSYHYPWWRHWREAKLTFNPLRNILIRKFLGYADKTVAVSCELKEALEENGIKVDAVIYNGIKLDSEFGKLVYQTPRSSIFFGGRLSISKGIFQAVRYLKILKEKFGLTPELRIAGEKGVAAEKMKKEAKKLGVFEQLEFLGWLGKKDYERHLGESSLVIVPSICFDSLPTIILEAMKFKKPVVATNLGGAKELVIDGLTGFIEDPFDIEKFTQRIAGLLQDQQKSKSMGEAGYQQLKENFSAEKMVARYLELV